MKPRILLAGLGETGAELARKLVHNWDVIAVDPDPAAAARATVDPARGESLRVHTGDATSALVLRKAGLEGVHAAVACTGDDETNLEVLHLAREQLRIHNLYTLMYVLTFEQRYRGQGVEVVSQDRACAAILESRIAKGQKVAADVGLGIGEIMEVEVLADSSVIGRPLMDLKPQRWLVGAIYRDGVLVVPHGDARLEQGDRVLIVGDPDILPSIATLIRTGESEFPLQYGSHVVTILGRHADQVLDEAGYLIEATRAERFEAIACDADAKAAEALARRCDEIGIPYELTCNAEDNLASLAHEVARSDVGLLILPHEPLGWLARVGLGRSRTSRIVDLVHSPVLVSRRTTPYRRVLLVLAALPFPTEAAQLAIDVVRIVGAELQLALVHQPEIVVGAELADEIERRGREIVNLAGMYHVETSVRRLAGNPIAEVVGASREYDLIVLPFRKGRRAFLTRPSVALNIIHRAACSVMVMPV